MSAGVKYKMFKVSGMVTLFLPSAITVAARSVEHALDTILDSDFTQFDIWDDNLDIEETDPEQ